MRIILDTDPGNGFPGADIDDGLALGLVLASPELSLEAVTIVGGNTAVERGVASARLMLGLAGASVPVYAGSPRAILEDSSVWRSQLDGFGTVPATAELWRDIAPPPPAAPDAELAADALVRIVNRHAGEITLVAVGPLTNVAQAFLLDPTLPGKLSQLVIMGGGFALRQHLHEMNFGYDPEAAQIVLSSGAPILLVPLDATLKTTLTREDNARLIASGRPLARYLGQTTDPWIRYVERSKGRPGCPLHDPLAVAAMLDPSIVTVEEMRVAVELQGGLTRGRSIAWQPGGLVGTKSLPAGNPISVVVDVDNKSLVEFMLGRLTNGA